MKINRLFTQLGVHPFDAIEWEKRSSIITNPDGSIVFEIKDAEVPKSWSQLATDIVASKYFRKAGVPTESGRETSVRQVVTRIANTIREAGETLGGYFSSPEDAEAFEAELTHILVNQIGAFNSPVWFNCGLHHQYGIEGSGGNWHWDAEKREAVELKNNYESPQCSACFIQSIDDSLMSIFELLKNEAKIFKYGSGTGTNFSKLRGSSEPLSGGGTSSGLMSFLEVFDRAAGATKSGGTTRRAAKMVCLDMDHPEITEFIKWKAHEENKARALIREGFPADFNGEAYKTVSGQNSNNSVRLTDDFMEKAINGGAWETRERLSGKPAATYDAGDLMNMICEATWQCADPGVQFDSTINSWHTCSGTDRIRASNPCSEYMFLDDSACNLSSINLVKLLREDGSLDVEMYRHVVEILFIGQEILVDFSSYPTKGITVNSHRFRPLGLGYANLGAMLMRLGIGYDDPRGTAICGALTAIMTGCAYATSAKMAAMKGTFECYPENRESMLRVMNRHRDCVGAISREYCPEDLLQAAQFAWDEAIEYGERHGYRNAQASVLAPTGTIGLLMDCDTTGIEPDFSLVKFKKLAGGGFFKIVNASVPEALRRLGYTPQQANEILAYVGGTLSLEDAPHVNRQILVSRGLTDAEVDKAQAALKGAFDLASVFSSMVIGNEAYARLGLRAMASGADLLARLGFSSSQLEEAETRICGRMTVEGAPHLRDEHLPVFDCANPCGRVGKRFIAPIAHLRMMAAAQPFISGAISKTVNIPNNSTVEDIRNLYVDGWKMGLKAVAIYRDGCKASQPLNSSASTKKDEPEAAVAEEAAVEVPARMQDNPAIVYAHGDEPVPARRRRLPRKRGGFTQEARVGGHKVFLRTGEYEDGSLGEIFIDMHKAGSALRSMINCFAIAVSKGLQYGVPLEEYVDTFIFTRFEPQGMVDHPNIRMATSVIDFAFRVLGLEYLGRTDFCQVKPDDAKALEQRAVDSALDIMQKRLQNGSANGHANGKKVKPAADTYQGEDPVLEDGIGDEALAQVMAREQAALNRSGNVSASAMSRHMEEMMGDAPFCENCGSVTVRNGACYRCDNCGTSMGCS